MAEQINPEVPPSGTGCADCLAGDGPGWWVHLRRCAECGHIGCCGSSPSQHSEAHYEQSGHSLITSFEPDEDWFYDFETDRMVSGPRLAGPDSHPADQPAPGPAGKVPTDWRQHIHM